MSQAVVLIKVSTSEEIITMIKEDHDDYYMLDRPRTLAPMQAEDGRVQIAMFHWMMGAQDPNSKFESFVKLEKTAIVGLVTEPPKALVDKYLAKVTGIEIFTG